ncbi:NAD(P)-dependent alcohol dehydrogenase [Shimia thalassica]|uniref:NAD(P)-dependent alcohol dehydrogenase n=1 Tax=Shimia thalassica TaxID=1715693 RepID=UPI0027375A8A|nr:NAD(P)-dependent alcohol dehydrogenase [Shimia thalassica]
MKRSLAMFAFAYHQYGSPNVLRKAEYPDPQPKPDEVLVKVYATTVSSGDWRARSLSMPDGLGWLGRLVFGVRKPRKPVLGTEFSGVIEQVGTKVSGFKIGDAVIGFPGARFGAHAEYITMRAARNLVMKPDTIPFEIAAAIPFGGTTAYDFLVNKGTLRAGETVLVNGASGAVGSACVQIAHHIGAHVTAVCSSSNAEMVRQLGADRVIDYQIQDFTAEGAHYDMVVDTFGSAPWVRTQHALKRGGRMLLVAGNASDMFFGGLKARLRGKRLIGGVASERRDILKTVVDLAEAGAFSPVIDRCYAFDDMPLAHALVDSGRKKGNVVVSVVS